MSHSSSAALVMLGFTGKKLAEGKAEMFRGFEELGDVLFVSAGQPVFID